MLREAYSSLCQASRFSSITQDGQVVVSPQFWGNFSRTSSSTSCSWYQVFSSAFGLTPDSLSAVRFTYRTGVEVLNGSDCRSPFASE